MLCRRANIWDSTQREAALVGCRGSPGSGPQRTRSDRRGDWDPEKQPVQIQQTEGTSVADAGDGGAEGMSEDWPSILSFNLNKLMRDLVELTK